MCATLKLRLVTVLNSVFVVVLQLRRWGTFIITWVQTYVNPTAPFYQCERGIWGYVHGIINITWVQTYVKPIAPLYQRERGVGNEINPKR